MIGPSILRASSFLKPLKTRILETGITAEGAELSYLCFAKVLENKLPLSLEELKPLAQHYIEMLKADLYMKRLCGVSVSLNDQIISDEVRLCADIFIKYLKSRMTQT